MMDRTTLTVVVIWIVIVWINGPRIRHWHLRGNRMTGRLALWWKLWRFRTDPNTFVWGRRRLPRESAPPPSPLAASSRRAVKFPLAHNRDLGESPPPKLKV